MEASKRCINSWSALLTCFWGGCCGRGGLRGRGAVCKIEYCFDVGFDLQQLFVGLLVGLFVFQHFAQRFVNAVEWFVQLALFGADGSADAEDGTACGNDAAQHCICDVR